MTPAQKLIGLWFPVVPLMHSKDAMTALAYGGLKEVPLHSEYPASQSSRALWIEQHLHIHTVEFDPTDYKPS